MQDETFNIKASNTIDSGHAQHFDIEFPKDGTEPVITSNIVSDLSAEEVVQAEQELAKTLPLIEELKRSPEFTEHLEQTGYRWNDEEIERLKTLSDSLPAAPEISEEPTVDQQPVYEAIGGQTMSRSEFNEAYGIPTPEPQCDFQPLPDPEVNALLDLLAADYNERLTADNIEADVKRVSGTLERFKSEDGIIVPIDRGTQSNVAMPPVQVTEFQTQHFRFKNPA